MTTFVDIPLSAFSWSEEDTEPGSVQLRFKVPYTGPIRAGQITATITIEEINE